MSPNGRICSTFLFSILFSFPHENSYFLYCSLLYFSFSLFLIYFQPYIDLLTGNTFDSRYSFFFSRPRLEIPTPSANIDGSSWKLPRWQ